MSTTATVATDRSSAPGNSRRSGLTADQRDAIRQRLKRLTALEVNPAKLAAGVHLAPVAAYGIAIRDAALDALAKLDERKAKVVEMRFFGGLTVEETAAALSVSPDTVMRDWRLAKAWLLRELRGSSSEK